MQVFIVFSLDEYRCENAVLAVFDNDYDATAYAIDLMELHNVSTRIVSRDIGHQSLQYPTPSIFKRYEIRPREA